MGTEGFRVVEWHSESLGVTVISNIFIICELRIYYSKLEKR